MANLIILFAIVLIASFFRKLRSPVDKTTKDSVHPHRHGIGHNHGEGFSIDFYAYTSKIRHWNAAFKVSLSVLTVTLCILLDNSYVSVTVIIAMAYIIIIKGKLPIHRYLPILAVQMGFILLSIFTIAIDFSKQPTGQYNLYFAFCYISTSQAKLKTMFLLLLKIFAAISALQMMILSTPSSEVICVLKKAHVPKLIIELMNIIYRYIFILMDVFTKMKISAESRQGYCDFKTSCHTFGNIASNMLIVSLKKANSYYDAMEARGYDGELLFLEEEKKIEKIQIVLAAAFLIFLILLWDFTR